MGMTIAQSTGLDNITQALLQHERKVGMGNIVRPGVGDF
jgi:hypothetical protein